MKILYESILFGVTVTTAILAAFVYVAPCVGRKLKKEVKKYETI